jgi:hypothetical protein
VKLVASSGSRRWTWAMFCTTADGDDFIQAVHGLVSSLRKTRLQLVLGEETIC